MTRDLTEMERRCLDAVSKQPRGTHPLSIIQLVIREMRVPTSDMIHAMQQALYKGGYKRMHHVTTTLKHQVRWAAAVDVASPP